MLRAAEAAIEDLLIEGRSPSAIAAAHGWRAAEAVCEPALRRLTAGVYALEGLDRALAASVDPRLLAIGDDDDAAAAFDDIGDEARSHDYLAVAVISAWSGDAQRSYANMRIAHDRALTEGRAAFALGALERFAHHALLFGDVSEARAAISAATALATERRSVYWRIRCTALAARIAAEVGEWDVAAALLERERAALLPPDSLALFAPTGAYLSVTADDAPSLQTWTSERVLQTALHSNALESSIAAATACMFATGVRAKPAPLAAAVRRALLAVENAAGAADLFSTAARFADVAQARFALMALGAVVAPNRRYLQAHRRLAEAYAGFRFGEPAAAAEHAGDAARAFDSLGLRRWTNEAMLLLVHRERSPEPASRRRPTALSLTDREQQVAHLIRRGSSNREIAHALQISEHTVERHVSSILSRLGLRSRWQIVNAKKLDG